MDSGNGNVIEEQPVTRGRSPMLAVADAELSSKKMVEKTGLTSVNPLLNTPKKKRNQCQGCGKSDVPMEMDHTAPKSKGGRGTIAICRDCNRTKGAKDNFDFQDMLEWSNYKTKHATVIAGGVT